MIEPAEIDRFFVPRPRADVAFVEIDGEAVIAAPEGDDGRLLIHWLNPIGTIVWQCFDGAASLDELIADLVDAFGADPDIVTHDVVELSRALGRTGLLDGVTAQLPLGRAGGDGYEPEGLPQGSEVPRFSRRATPSACMPVPSPRVPLQHTSGVIPVARSPAGAAGPPSPPGVAGSPHRPAWPAASRASAGTWFAPTASADAISPCSSTR